MSNQSLKENLSDKACEVISYAIENDLSLSKAARAHVDDSDVRSFVRRVKRRLKKAPGGDDLLHLFLRQGAKYDRQIAAELVCSPRRTDDVIVWAKVPFSDICNRLPDSQGAYQVLYNRIYRKDPDLASTLTGEKEDEGDSRSVFQFFKIGPHELQSIE